MGIYIVVGITVAVIVVTFIVSKGKAICPCMLLAGKKENNRDPVCGMDVSPGKEAAVSEYKGTKYYFCATGCKVNFDKDPEKYLKNDTKKCGCCGH
jgi:YHS domain-containing protein